MSPVNNPSRWVRFRFTSYIPSCKPRRYMKRVTRIHFYHKKLNERVTSSSLPSPLPCMNLQYRQHKCHYRYLNILDYKYMKL
jgi:hypothetical protein